MRVFLKHSFFIVLVFCFAACNNVEQESLPEVNDISWSKQIAPIIFKNCTPCHRPGESGAFNLLRYGDVQKRARLIKFVTQTSYMPPWPADAEYTHFIDEKVLSQKEKTLLKMWIENNCPRGDSLNEPAVPEFYKGSYFGKPDLVIKAQKAVKIKGNGTDVFLIMKFPYTIEKDTLIDFVEFVPDHRKLIHHVNGHLISYDNDRKSDHMRGESVSADIMAKLMQVYASMNIPYNDNLLPAFPRLTPNTVYYLPGYIPPVYPPEVGGYKLKQRGAFLLNNIHFGPSNADISDSSCINVFYRKSAIQRPILETQMGTFGVSKIEPDFIIPPNTIKTFHTKLTLSQSISILSVNPHMHLLGKTFHAFALKANGDTIPLIRIKKWDFRWQYYYTYKLPVKLEAGTSIHVYGSYDNTSNNLNNPNRPPKTVTHGNGVESMKTTEEMFQFIFTYLPYKNGDELIDMERKK